MKNIIRKLQHQKIGISVNNDNLLLDIPGNISADDIILEVKQNKQKLIDYIQSAKSYKTNYYEIVHNEKSVYESVPNQRRRYLKYMSTGYGPENAVLDRKIKNVDKRALKKAIDTLVLRHDSLRTLFFYENGKVFQKIYPIDFFESNLFFEDISENANPEKLIKLIIEDASDYLFDLEKEQSFKFKLIKYSEEEYMLILIIDHMLRDAHSVDIIKEELFLLYNAFSKELKNPLEPLNVQFGDYSDFHNQSYTGLKYENHYKYFKNLFKNLPPRLKVNPEIFGNKQLYSSTQDNKKQNDFDSNSDLKKCKIDDGGCYTFLIPMDILSDIKKLSSKLEVTIFNFFLAGYSLFLHRISGQKDFVIDSPISTRDMPNLSKVVGWITGALVLRVIVDENSEFRDLLVSCQEVIFEAMNHKYYQDYVEDLNLNPKQQIATQLNLITNAKSGEEIIEFYPSHDFLEKVMYDFSFSVMEYKNGMLVNCSYRNSLISKNGIVEICDEFLATLRSAIKSLL